MRRRGDKDQSSSHLSPNQLEAGISTWHTAKSKIGCYGVNGPVPLTVLDKNLFKELINSISNI